jgi:hypothetical protein
MRADNTTEFLHRLKDTYRLQERGNSIPIRVSEERQKIFDSIKTGLPSNPSLTDRFQPLDEMLQEIGAAMVLALPSTPSFPVSFGVIEAREINARTFRSKQDAVSICLNASVPILLNKLIKLRVAHALPQSVTHYSRGPVQEMQSQDYASLARQQLLNYVDSREIRGPYIELNPQGILMVGCGLYVAESFLLGHEVAHIGIAAGSYGEIERTIMESLEVKENLARELAADIIGAALSREAILQIVGQVPAASVPLGVGRICELLAAAGDPSEHYPPPLMRLTIVLRAWFDSSTTEQLLKKERAEDWLSLGMAQ